MAKWIKILKSVCHCSSKESKHKPDHKNKNYLQELCSVVIFSGGGGESRFG